MSDCPYCTDRCVDADLAPLLSDHLLWLWKRVAKLADLRGDVDMTEGHIDVTAPQEAEARAAAVGLLGGAPLRAAQTRTVDLAVMTAHLRARGASLTPGAVAAHAVRRRLAIAARRKNERTVLLQALQDDLEKRMASLPDHVRDRVDGSTAWTRLRSAGWHSRLADHPDPASLVRHAAAVLAALPEPGERIDRRTLVPTQPHALDEGTPLANLVLTLAHATGMRTRVAWDSIGVDCDDLTGGLLTLGIHPIGWTLPPDAVVTIPPRELRHPAWPTPPAPDAWVFVTENPSVVAAAADLAARATSASVRLLCTVGTPSELEVASIATLASVGWRVAVRADFDLAGLAHVRAVLAACPAALPWRMRTADYVASNPSIGDGAAITVSETDTPWDDELGRTMTSLGAPGFEEALLPVLLADLAHGRPG